MSIAARLDAACVAVGRKIAHVWSDSLRRITEVLRRYRDAARARDISRKDTFEPYWRRRRKRWSKTRWHPDAKSDAKPSTKMPPWLPPATGPMPYRRAKSLLSQGERAAWVPIYLAVKRRYRLFCKVRLLDIVECPPTKFNQPNWFKPIRGYHVDFLLCDPDSTEPLLVIELDDRSHQTARSKERDRHKDAVLKAAGIPILRVRAQQAYSTDELRQQIDALIGRG